MSFLQNSSLGVNFLWTQRDATSSATIIESSTVAYDKQFASGTGISQASKVYYTSGTLGSGQNAQFDLFNLQRSIFGSNQTINFSGGKIKAFYIENGGTGQFNIVNTGSAGFSFNFLGSGVILHPTGLFTCVNQTGFNITTGQRYFGLINNDFFTNMPYEIAILGN